MIRTRTGLPALVAAMTVLLGLLAASTALAAAPPQVASFDTSNVPIHTATGSGDVNGTADVAQAKFDEASAKEEAAQSAPEPEAEQLRQEAATLRGEAEALQAEGRTITNVATATGAFRPGQSIVGAGIPAGTRVEKADAGAHTLTISQTATASGTAVALSAESVFTPTRLAVNEASGDVYVIDRNNDAIDKFAPDGSFVSQIAGSSTTAGSFLFGGEEDDIAIDNTQGSTAGRIYVNSEEASLSALPSTFAFDPSGAFLWEAGGFTQECGIGVDPANGNLYAMDLNSGFQQLDSSDGSAIGSAVVLTGLPACHFEFGSTGALIASQYGGRIDKFDPLTGARILKYQSSESHVDVAIDLSNDRVYGPTGSHQIEAWDDAASGNRNPLSWSPFGPSLPRGATVDAQRRRLYVTTGGEVLAFDLTEHTLGATAGGTGSGSLTCEAAGEPAGPCAASYSAGTEVTVTAVPASGSAFTGWANGTGPASACAGTGPCTFTLSADASLEAVFSLVEHQLTVNEVGSGSVSCDTGSGPGPCAASYPEGEFITLAASPDPHYVFVGFSGDCTGTAPCSLELNADAEVTATFALEQESLTLAKAGSGSGSVTCNGGACAATYPYGTEVTLAATAAAGSTFAGFSGGGCSASPCTLTLTGATALTATFNANPPSGGSGGSPPATPPPLAITPAPVLPKALTCKKGFVKKHGRCVRKHHPRRHRRHHR